MEHLTVILSRRKLYFPCEAQCPVFNNARSNKNGWIQRNCIPQGHQTAKVCCVQQTPFLDFRNTYTHIHTHIS